MRCAGVTENLLRENNVISFVEKLVIHWLARKALERSNPSEIIEAQLHCYASVVQVTIGNSPNLANLTMQECVNRIQAAPVPKVRGPVMVMLYRGWQSFNRLYADIYEWKTGHQRDMGL